MQKYELCFADWIGTNFPGEQQERRLHSLLHIFEQLNYDYFLYFSETFS